MLAAAALALVAPAAAAELPAALVAKVAATVDADTPRLNAVFKDLHQHPELAFTETRTAGIVARELKALGFTVTTGVGKTGVVGVLKNGPGPTLWFRADIVVPRRHGCQRRRPRNHRAAMGGEGPATAGRRQRSRCHARLRP
ncbi:MAG TPA: hypothetical protein PK808_04505 [Polymorphobacter sp.]|nr:hypothetical protein [Polymorphobacter sp.]